MAVDTRRAAENWLVLTKDGHLQSEHLYAFMQTTVLMDIRDELVRLNSLLHCSNFVQIPTTLRSIRKAMPVRRKAKKP